MIASVSGAIFIECNIEHPVQGVLDTPVSAHRIGEACRTQSRRGDIAASHRAGAAIALGGRFDHGEHSETRHGVLIGIATIGEQPDHIVADNVSAGLHLAVIGIGGGICLTAGRRIGEVLGDVLQHERAVGLQGEQPVAAPWAHHNARSPSGSGWHHR